MLLGVISDTHKHIGTIEKAMEKLKNTEMIIHLGDNVQDVREIEKRYNKEIVYVRGNCDFSFSTPEERVIVVENHKILITHGHDYEVKDGLFRVRYKALEVGADLVLYGHTHISKIDYEEGIFYVNPGSTALSRDGFNSVAIIDVQKNLINPSIVHI